MTAGGLCVCLLLLLCLGACKADDPGDAVLSGDEEEQKRIVLTTGFSDDEVFRIGKNVCSMDEFMLYLTNTQNYYERIYGSSIWSVSAEGITLEDKIKDSVGAQLAQIKTLNLLAEENHVTLSAEELLKIRDAAEEYVAGLNPDEKEQLHVTSEAVADYYSQYLTAHKVYTYIIRDINPEISDDEARNVTVDWIYFESEPDNNQVKQKVYRVLAEAQSGEDFERLAAENSDDVVLTHSFGKGEVRQEIESAAFELAEGEISDVFFCQDGYYILRCVSTFDRDQTDENKLKIVEQRKNEAFNEVYGSFAGVQIKQINEKNWEEISLIHDSRIQTSAFFEIYEKYFGES